MERRSHTPSTSSTIDPGTANGVVAETRSRWAAMSSAVGVRSRGAAQPSPRPTKARAKRRAQAAVFARMPWGAPSRAITLASPGPCLRR